MFSVRKVRDRIWQWLTPTAWAAWASSTSNPLRSWPHQLRGRINKLVHKSWHSSREAGQILKFFKGCHETHQTHQWLFKRNSEPEPMKTVLSTVDWIFGSLQGHWWWHGRDICSWWRRSVRQKRSVWRQPAEIPTKPRSTHESRLTGGIWLHDLVCMQFAIMAFEDKMKKTLRLGQSEETHGRYFMTSCIVWFIYVVISSMIAYIYDINWYIIFFVFAYISFARTWSEDAVSCRALQLGQGALLRSLLKGEKYSDTDREELSLNLYLLYLLSIIKDDCSFASFQARENALDGKPATGYRSQQCGIHCSDLSSDEQVWWPDDAGVGCYIIVHAPMQLPCYLYAPHKDPKSFGGTHPSHNNVADHIQKSACPQGSVLCTFAQVSLLPSHIIDSSNGRLLPSTRLEMVDTWTTLVCCPFSSARPDHFWLCKRMGNSQNSMFKSTLTPKEVPQVVMFVNTDVPISLKSDRPSDKFALSKHSCFCWLAWSVLPFGFMLQT